MKRLMIITAVFALLLTGCGTRVSHDTLIELSVSSYALQSSTLHNQIKFLELPRRNSGIFFGYSNLSTTFVASIN